jgi:hypothetical protein
MLIFLSLSPIYVAFSALLFGSETWTIMAGDNPRKFLKLMRNYVTDYSVITLLTLTIWLFVCQNVKE